jgi:hypothetical protein
MTCRRTSEKCPFSGANLAVKCAMPRPTSADRSPPATRGRRGSKNTTPPRTDCGSRSPVRVLASSVITPPRVEVNVECNSSPTSSATAGAEHLSQSGLLRARHRELPVALPRRLPSLGPLCALDRSRPSSTENSRRWRAGLMWSMSGVRTQGAAARVDSSVWSLRDRDPRVRRERRGLYDAVPAGRAGRFLQLSGEQACKLGP